jgi:DNA-3-methyladenine glycosylase I
VNEQTWSNFKNEAARFQGKAGADYVHALHEVWSVMYRLQESVGSDRHAGDIEKRPDVEPDYAGIFRAAEATLFRVGGERLDVEEMRAELDEYRQIATQRFTDDEYFRKLVHVVFYSGFKAEEVEKRLPTIDKYLADYHLAATYGKSDIEGMLADPEMIHNRRKLDACVKNAKLFRDIVAKSGSFEKYVNAFSPKASFANLMKLRKDLQRFGFLAGITSLHFLMDIGLPVLKPDRAVTRIFFRLGLIESEGITEAQLLKIVEVGHRFAAAAREPIRYIDAVFAAYGQVNSSGTVLQQGICLKINPRCNICGLKPYCRYSPVAA